MALPVDGDSLGFHGHTDKTLALVWVGIVVCVDQHTHPVRLGPVGRPHLTSVDHPLIPLHTCWDEKLEHSLIKV